MSRSNSVAWTCLFIAIAIQPALAQSTTRVSVDSSGTQGNAGSYYSAISGDGRYVVFFSDATNLVPGDTNGVPDVFVRDRQTGTTIRASVDSSGAQANGQSVDPVISADGRYVAFTSSASNLVSGDTNGTNDVFVRDLLMHTTSRVSVDSSGVEANLGAGVQSLSSDGRYVAFFSGSSNLVPGDTNNTGDIFVHDRQTGITERVSVDSSGAQGNANCGYYPVISANGRFVAFTSYADNLVPGDTNGVPDTFVHDRQTGITERVSVDSSGVQGNNFSIDFSLSLSSDGRFVAFMSDASNLVPADTNSATDVFVRDRQASQTFRVSVDSAGTQGNAGSFDPSISADGRFVAFDSAATNLVTGDTNGFGDVFIRDRLTSATSRVSFTSSGGQGNANCGSPSISVDGRFIAFLSSATNLVPGDTNTVADVFVRDRGPSMPVSFCFGDGTLAACPCGNSGAPAHGCQNSATTGGAILSATGNASLSADTLVLITMAELPSALSIPSQGTQAINPVFFGDGLRCVGGTLKRLYVKSAVGGVVTAPQTGDPSISARSTALGDPIPMGASRFYYTYYRDPNLTFCPDPPGKTWNISSNLAVVWSP